MNSRRLLVAVLSCAAASSAVASGQHSSGAELRHVRAHAAVATGELGELSFPNSGNRAAQAPFLRGVKLLHNFQYDEAVEAFRQAQKADPNFALAYWGEAMAHNYTLWANQQPDLAREALGKLGPTPEARAAKARTRREKMWLQAVETLYGPGSKYERDEAYADRMDALFAAFPTDFEARVFDALALMGRSHGTRDVTNYMKAAAMLEEVFPSHMHHPGVVHYLIHAYDDPTHASLGLRAARIYDKVAPDSAHAQHMTSHIFLAMGMWPETEEANVHALAVHNAARAAQHAPPTHCGHGSIWLVYARLQQGKDVEPQLDACRADAVASETLPKDPPIVGAPEAEVGSWADMAVRTGIETGKWPSWIKLPPGRFMFAQFLEDYGRVLQSRHDPAAAEVAFQSLEADAGIVRADFKKEFPDDETYLPWIDRAVAQSQAIVTLARGRTEEGLTLLRSAASREAELPPPFGPPALQKPSYELLGDELLALGRKEEAASAYQAALAAAPNRRLSVLGLRAASAR